MCAKSQFIPLNPKIEHYAKFRHNVRFLVNARKFPDFWRTLFLIFLHMQDGVMVALAI